MNYPKSFVFTNHGQKLVPSVPLKLRISDLLPLINKSGSSLHLNEDALNFIIERPEMQKSAMQVCDTPVESPGKTAATEAHAQLRPGRACASQLSREIAKQASANIGARIITFLNLVPETVAQARKIDDSFSSDAEDDKPLTHLKALESALFKIFRGEQLGVEDLQLSSAEMQILAEVLLRKYKGSINLKALKRPGAELQIEEVIRCANALAEEASIKRFEENIKFVFKLAFRRLKSNLLKQNRIAFYSKKFDNQFYEHYFKETAERLAIDIKEFYDPLNTKSKAKSLNIEYLKLIFNSPAFKIDFVRYIDSETVKLDYQNTLKRKIRQLLLKFDHCFGSENDAMVTVGLEKVQHYFRKNRQCKLPWTNTEIVTAVNTFIFMMRTI